jgi:hypothetical protein
MSNDIKQKIIDEIQNKVPVFKKITSIQYAIKCPLCGDSKKNLKATHCYIKSSFDPNEPILFNCFKCNSKGKVNHNFLTKLGINMDGISEFDKQLFNKISNSKSPTVDIICGNPIVNSDQIKYIEYRLGDGFTIDDYDKFKIVWDTRNIIPYITNVRIKNSIPSNNNSISFLSENKSVLLTRFFSDEEPRWRKIKLFPSSNRSIYTIKNTIDLLTKDIIYVNIAEGVFDILSVYKNFNTGPNSIYIATLGSDYISGIDYVIDNGIIGNNVVINIFLDTDIEEAYIKLRLKKLKWLFKIISIFKNIKAEDIGKRVEDINLIEYYV